MRDTDNYSRAIGCALLAACMLSVMNAITKILSGYLDPVEITFWRNIIALPILIGGMALSGNLNLMKTNRLWGQLLRAAVGTVGMGMAVWMFSLLSLAEGVAISFTAPLFVVLLARPLLKEPVGPHRLGAAFVGFFGVLLIAQPWNGFSMNVLGLVVGLTFAGLNASVIMSLRWLGETESAVTTVFYFLLFGLVGTSFIMPAIYTPIPQADWWLVAILGSVGLCSLLLKTESYRWGPAALVAPLSYSLILWAMMFDWLIWGKVPAHNVIWGAATIITSNVYIMWREHVRKRPPTALPATAE